MTNTNETKVFVSGSILIKKLKPKVKETLDKIMQQNFEIIVGDAYGVDEQVIKYCDSKEYYNLRVYYIYDNDKEQNGKEENLTRQKNLNKNFKKKQVDIPEELKGKKGKEREKQTYKDEKMAEDCTYAFVIWDEKSTGTYKNCKECYEQYKKKIKVYLNKQDRFISIKSQDDLNKIDEIYRKNTGFTKEEVCKELKIKNDELNKIMTDHKIHKKEGNKYVPEDKFKEYFIEKKHTGKYLSYNFTNDLITIIIEKIQNSPQNDENTNFSNDSLSF